MQIKNFGIREKIIAGFLILIIIFGLNGGYNLTTINTSEKVLWEIFEEKDPSIQILNQFRFLISRSLNYASGIIYDYSKEESNDKLTAYLGNDIPQLKSKLTANGVFWKDGEAKKLLKEYLVDFEKFQAAVNDFRKVKLKKTVDADSLALKKYNEEVVPLANALLEKASVIIMVKETEKAEAEKTLTAFFSNLKNSMFTLGLLIIIICIATSLYTSGTVLGEIKRIANLTNDLSKGIHPPLIENVKNDEIGIMATGINQLISGLKQTTEFAENIGKGNFQSSFTPLSNEDVLGNSLINMRDNLKKVAEEDKLRNWANEGYAKFNDLLRNNYNNKEEFSSTLLSSLVKYMGANQGMFYVVNHDKQEEFLEEVASYAWDRKKFGKSTYKKGEGLAGQAWIENEFIFLTEVPEEYVHIKSGIGLATPRSVVIVPLKYNEITFGIIELASLKEFSQADVDFILKLAENIAVTISNSSNTEKMKKLLDESQQKTEQLRQQEEEIRQNMEELMATQEQLLRNKENLNPDEA